MPEKYLPLLMRTLGPETGNEELEPWNSEAASGIRLIATGLAPALQAASAVSPGLALPHLPGDPLAGLDRGRRLPNPL